MGGLPDGAEDGQDRLGRGTREGGPPPPRAVWCRRRQLLDNLQMWLELVADRELATLKALKGEACGARGLAPEETFFLWDFRSYDRLHVEHSLGLDHNAVNEHFPVVRAAPTILAIYQDLRSVRFGVAPRAHAPVWHEDVQAFAVWERMRRPG
jgi:Zn-dependent oligopeptidase